MNRLAAASAAILIASLGATACDDKPQTQLAPTASALEQSKPKAQGAITFDIASPGSKIGLTMDAPLEKIRGKVHDATTGNIDVDLSDISKTTGKLTVNISGMELFQRQRADDKGEFGQEVKKDKQNEHARNWLEIGDKQKPEVRDKNSRIVFSITKVEADSKDLTKLTGAERKVTATVTGDFLLHGHKSVHSAKVEITVKMKGDQAESVHVKSIEPFAVDLAKHDVRPRDALGKLAAKTLEMLVDEGRKITKEALVTVDFAANVSGAAKR